MSKSVFGESIFDMPPYPDMIHLELDQDQHQNEDNCTMHFEIHQTGAICLIGDPLDKPIATFMPDLATVGLFEFLSEHLKRCYVPDSEVVADPLPSAPDKKPAQPELSPEFKEWSKK